MDPRGEVACPRILTGALLWLDSGFSGNPLIVLFGFIILLFTFFLRWVRSGEQALGHDILPPSQQ